MVVDGVNVEHRDGGRVRGAQARVVDFDRPSNNGWLAVQAEALSRTWAAEPARR